MTRRAPSDAPALLCPAIRCGSVSRPRAVFPLLIRIVMAGAGMPALFMHGEALRLVSSAWAADPQPYTVELAKTGDAAIDQALTDSATLISLRTSSPVGGFALVARAQSDLDRLQTALNSFGYYKGKVTIRIAGKTLDDPDLPTLIERAPKQPPLTVTIAIEKGPLFHLRNVRVETPPGTTLPDMARNVLPVKTSDPAIAANVLAGQSALLNALQNNGYALAKVQAPEAFERPDQNVLDVVYKVTPGPRVDLGPITFSGLKHTNASYVERRLLLKSGQEYQADKIGRARQDLLAAGIFSSVRMRAADRLNTEGRLPLRIEFTERPRHGVSLDGLYSTDLGGSLTGTWTYRNIFGNGETLALSAAATEVAAQVASQPGYNIGAVYTIPDWLRRNQSLQFYATGVREYFYSYDRTAIIVGATLTRKLSDHWNGSIGLTAIQERVGQQGVRTNYTLVQVPVTLKYDDTGSLFEPTHGYRAIISATPTESLPSGGSGASKTFVLMKAQGSTYINLSRREGRSILALRALVGAAPGVSLMDLPPDQRFYAGGSDTIRGYKYQFVGPTFPNNDPTGGTAVDAATVELRQRFGSSYGVALFVDAGQVSQNGGPFSGDLRVGAGIGARYYTAIGPIRVDFALPLMKQRGNSSFQAYIGIGEAF
ncbi:Outer membrane protein [Granulibacter bethesdensis]|uniref:autotransporter assembly complex protein TamA n=1 Tax=Granulibacter bethesdensis TaxID=364410 RepID=UPI0009098C30|nr:BamA/TamA family outer membrane protein [Granulibacter bethesdensis]APH55898.1 Outer membrane protein [Granulibacter bethesdensis]